MRVVFVLQARRQIFDVEPDASGHGADEGVDFRVWELRRHITDARDPPSEVCYQPAAPVSSYRVALVSFAILVGSVTGFLVWDK